VEKYADATAWEALGPDERNELVGDLAGLPSEVMDEDLEAKQFDLLMLRLQLDLLRHERSFTRWSDDVRQIAGPYFHFQIWADIREGVLVEIRSPSTCGHYVSPQDT